MFSVITVLPIIVFILIMYRGRNWDTEARVAGSIVGFLCSIMVAAGLSALIRVMTPVASPPVEFGRVKIVALSASTSIGGTFFLGSGNIEGRPAYYFYFEIPNGGKKLTSLNADDVTLYEEDRKDAFLVKVDRVNWDAHGQLWNFFVPRFLWRDMKANSWSGGYAIHLPKGSIKEEIRLELPR